MPGHYGSANQGKSSSSSGGGWSPGVQHSGMPTRRTTTTTGGGWSPGVGGQQHIPKTRPKPKVQTGDGWTPGAGNRYINPYVNPNKSTSGITGSNKFKQLQQWILNNQKESIGIGTASTLGPLSFLKGKEYLGDVSKINQWSKMGYGTGNPVPEKMLSTLKGSWVPNKTFEKLGYGPGSLKDWWNKTISPQHFQPAQKVINPALRGLGTLAKGVNVASMPLAYMEAAGALQNRLESQGLTGEGGIADISGGWGAEAARADVEYDYNKGGLVNSYILNELVNAYYNGGLV